MPGLHHCALIALLACCDAFSSGPSHRDAARRAHGDGPIGPRLFQEHVRAKRQAAPELVQVQPRLVHDIRQPEIHKMSSSTVKMVPADSSDHGRPDGGRPDGGRPDGGRPDGGRTLDAVEENLNVKDEMERMVHLTVPRVIEDLKKKPDFSDSETDVLGGTGDVSRESSGFYGNDMEDRERGEDGGEDREKREGEDEWDNHRGTTGRQDQDVLEANHTVPDLDALIGYSPGLQTSTLEQPRHLLPTGELGAGIQEHRGHPVLEEGPLHRELWTAEGEKEVQSSGDGLLHASVTTAAAAGSLAASSTTAAVATAAPQTYTGTDFGLQGGFTRAAGQEEEEEEEREEEEDFDPFTQNPTAAEVGLSPSREPLQPSVEEEETLEREKHVLQGSKPSGGEDWGTGRTTGQSSTGDFPDSTYDWLEMTTPLQSRQQVVCLDWSELAWRGYVILNMTHNLNCEEFRVNQGVRLLKTLERVFARRMNSPEGSWTIYLSKPTHQQHQLLMNVASERGVIATKDVLSMLGEISKHLNSMSIQNFSPSKTCQSRPSQTRSDYGKLFVVLVIIGSICIVIITSGFIYICWQRRLPATKTTFRAEELHFVENGCHDNPTLDVTNDGQAGEMREKKPSTNGLTGGGGGGGGGGDEHSRWQVFVNEAATEDDEEEQDTHL